MTDDDPRLAPALTLVGRTGASNCQLRYSDDELPVIWMAIAEFDRGGKAIYAVGAGLEPLQAVFKLCDELLDGGQCAHCNRPSGFDSGSDPMPLDELVCWYQFDPGAAKYVRGCA